MIKLKEKFGTVFLTMSTLVARMLLKDMRETHEIKAARIEGFEDTFCHDVAIIVEKELDPSKLDDLLDKLSSAVSRQHGLCLKVVL